jgi:uncharacterized protein YcaQ
VAVGTREALRAHAVGRSLFAPTDLLAAIATLGFVQLDPIRAPARAADLILRHRVAGYRVGDLDRAYPELPLAEDYLHVYGVLPAATRRLLHPRHDHRTWHVERLHPRLAAHILAHVRAHGATHPRDLAFALGRARVVNGWGGQSAATTRMLEALQYRGKLSVARREAGVRIYDFPAPLPRARAEASRADAILMLMLRLYAPLPEASFRRLARMATERSVSRDVREARLQRLLGSRRLRWLDADGVVYLLPADEALETEPPDGVRLLAPFDPVVWDRRRFAHLWGWDYRFEAYTPQARRKFGYYALPLLWRDDVIGWANAALTAGTLQVEAGFVRGRPRAPAFRAALEAEAGSLAAALGATDFAVRDVRP